MSKRQRNNNIFKYNDFDNAGSKSSRQRHATTEEELEVTADEVIAAAEGGETAEDDAAAAIADDNGDDDETITTESTEGDPETNAFINSLHYCTGVKSNMLRQVFQSAPHLVLQRYCTFPPGQFRHPKCSFILKDERDIKRKHCVKCSSVQKGLSPKRQPELYAARDNIKDSMTIDKNAIEILLKRKYEELNNDTTAFMNDDDVRFLFDVCRLYHPDIKAIRLCNLNKRHMNFCDCYHLKLNSSCRGFWLTGKPVAASITSCPYCAASKRNAEQRKINM